LANTFRYAALLRSIYSNRENVADAQIVAVNCGTLVSELLQLLCQQRRCSQWKYFLILFSTSYRRRWVWQSVDSECRHPEYWTRPALSVTLTEEPDAANRNVAVVPSSAIDVKLEPFLAYGLNLAFPQDVHSGTSNNLHSHCWMIVEHDLNQFPFPDDEPDGTPLDDPRKLIVQCNPLTRCAASGEASHALLYLRH
jgi:hypothetical protein